MLGELSVFPVKIWLLKTDPINFKMGKLTIQTTFYMPTNSILAWAEKHLIINEGTIEEKRAKHFLMGYKQGKGNDQALMEDDFTMTT